MKRIIKPMTLMFIMFQVIMLSLPSFATGTEVGDKPLIYVTKKIEGITMSYWGQEVIPYYTVYKNKDDEIYPAYCVDYYKGGATDKRSYTVELTGEYVDENIDTTILANNRKLGVWRAIINGYPFKTHQELNCADDYEAYAATKQAVFCMLEDRDLSLYKYEGEAGTRVYNAMVSIINTAKSSTKFPRSTKINLLEEEWKIDEINGKYLSKQITLNCKTEISSFRVTLEGNVPNGTIVTDLKNNKLTQFKNCKSFKVLIPLENMTNRDEFTVNVQGNAISYPMYFGYEPSGKLQSYVLTAGFIKQESSGSLIQYPENKTKLIIRKQDEEGNTLAGVKFNILDCNKNKVYEKLETNEKGVIEITNMVPGKYYLQETETIDGYEFNSELMEINIGLDEEKEIVVQNNKIPEEPEIPETPEEPEVPKTPEIPEIPETPETPIIPNTPETPVILEVPTLPRTGF